MLSPEQRAVIKSTVPLLETGGETLTAYFYEVLLREHPDVRRYFNQAHQQTGAQSRALANGVLMYARHIDELEELGDLVGVIVNKHVSLQIQPEHYPIVGNCLLHAIRAVLGAEIATDTVIEAWAIAYGQLADILIGAEKSVYDTAAAQVGGWRGGRTFTVVRKKVESDEICSFYLAPADGGPVVKHQPGQYIGLRLMIDGQDVRRNYSLSALSDGRQYRISIKRELGGLVSGFMHERMQVGDSLELFPPAGRFTLTDGGNPVVLISGGVGITPTLPMLEAALSDGRFVHFIHAARHAGVHAFRDHVQTLAQKHSDLLQHFYCYEQHDADDLDDTPNAVGRIDSTLLATWLPAACDADIYLLGPTPFMREIKAQLRTLGVPDTQVHFEFFGPAEALA